MWTSKRISADAAEKLQINAGLLLKNFNVVNPVEPSDDDIICETTGNFSISSVPTLEDFFADVNNAPANTKEGLRVTGWEHTLGVTAVSITEETLLMALNAKVAVAGTVGIRPGTEITFRDKLYWIGDMSDPDKLFVVCMENVASTGGLSFTSSDDGKGGLALSFRAYESVTGNPLLPPVSYHIIQKQDGTAAVSEE